MVDIYDCNLQLHSHLGRPILCNFHPAYLRFAKAGPDPIKKFSSVKLLNTGSELSDWLKNLENPIRVLQKNSLT